MTQEGSPVTHPNIFTVKPGLEKQNREIGESLRVIPARNGYGKPPSGVAVFAGPFLKFVLEEDHALALANSIADALEGKAS